MSNDKQQQLEAREDGPLLDSWQREQIRAANDADCVPEATPLQREHYLRWMLEHADVMEKALDRAGMALAVARGPHDESCGIDACGMCLIESTYDATMAVLRSDLNTEQLASLRRASAYTPPHPPRGSEHGFRERVVRTEPCGCGKCISCEFGGGRKTVTEERLGTKDSLGNTEQGQGESGEGSAVPTCNAASSPPSPEETLVVENADAHIRYGDAGLLLRVERTGEVLEVLEKPKDLGGDRFEIRVRRQ